MTPNQAEPVRIELTDEEYDTLRSFAGDRGLSLDEAGRLAVDGLLDRRGVDGTAPASAVLDDVDEPSLPERGLRPSFEEGVDDADEG
jgi:hypothetical protein